MNPLVVSRPFNRLKHVIFLLVTLTVLSGVSVSRTGLEASSPSAIGDVVLNELLFNPDSTAEGTQDCDGDGTPGEETGDNGADEFVELLNRGSTAVNLGGYCLSSHPAATAGSNDRWSFPMGTSIQPGAYLSVCGRTLGDGTGIGFSIQDSQGDEITGFNNGGEHVTLFEPNTLGNCGSGVANVVWEIAYPDGESNGQSYQRCPNGSGALDYVNPMGPHSAPSLNGENLCGAQAVALESAQIEQKGTEVVLRWRTVIERDWAGFYILRQRKDDERWHALTDEMIPVARPGAAGGASYTWVERPLPGVGLYVYRIEGIDREHRRQELVELPLYVRGLERVWMPLLERR